jgi:NADPH2:quinone reductase
MRAALYEEFGPIEAMRVAELPSPEPGPGQVLVSVQAVGMAFFDVLVVNGKYQELPKPPFSPGYELSGVVKAVGAGVTAFKEDDAVFGNVPNCCREEAVADPARLWSWPAGLSAEVAAGFGTNYVTSWYALKYKGGLRPGETLLVLGASGGVGIAAIEIGKLLGARVIACASTAEKLETCRRHGADELINYETEDVRARVKAITAGRGIDVCYDPVGDKYAEPMVRSMAWNGRYLVIGFAAGMPPKIPLNLALLKGISLIGVYFGGMVAAEPQRSREVYSEIIDIVASGKLKPLISKTYALGETVEALRALSSRQVQGKIVVLPRI